MDNSPWRTREIGSSNLSPPSMSNIIDESKVFMHKGKVFRVSLSVEIEDNGTPSEMTAKEAVIQLSATDFFTKDRILKLLFEKESNE